MVALINLNSRLITQRRGVTSRFIILEIPKVSEKSPHREIHREIIPKIFQNFSDPGPITTTAQTLFRLGEDVVIDFRRTRTSFMVIRARFFFLQRKDRLRSRTEMAY